MLNNNTTFIQPQQGNLYGKEENCLNFKTTLFEYFAIVYNNTHTKLYIVEMYELHQ